VLFRRIRVQVTARLRLGRSLPEATPLQRCGDYVPRDIVATIYRSRLCLVALREPLFSGEILTRYRHILNPFNELAQSGEKFTMKCIIENQVVLSQLLEGLIAAQIGSIAKSVGEQG